MGKEVIGMATTAPHLITDGNLKRCSACKMPFLAESHESLNVTFAKHVLAYHRSNQVSENAEQTDGDREDKHDR